jgi:RecA-family ATPase
LSAFVREVLWHVLSPSWLGKVTEPGPAIYLGAEDEENELHRRLADNLAHYDATFADAIAGGLHMLSYAGQDAVECHHESGSRGGHECNRTDEPVDGR